MLVPAMRPLLDSDSALFRPAWLWPHQKTRTPSLLCAVTQRWGSFAKTETLISLGFSSVPATLGCMAKPSRN